MKVLSPPQFDLDPCPLVSELGIVILPHEKLARKSCVIYRPRSGPAPKVYQSFGTRLGKTTVSDRHQK